MKILLINPPYLPERGKFSREQRSPAVTKSGTFYFPMWLCYAAGVLTEAGHNCELIDAPASQISFGDLINNLQGRTYDLVIVDTSTPSILNDCRFAKKLKDMFNAYTVIVGTHPSALPEESLRLVDGIDAAARGEYEITLKELAEYLDGKTDVTEEGLKTIDGLSFSNNGNVYHTKDRKLNSELDSLPFVSAVYKNHLRYTDYFYSHSKYPIVTTITGRGCPHRCLYCVYPQVFSGRQLRYRSIKNVVDEIEYILGSFPDVKEIMFEDDTLTINKKRCLEFAEEVLRRGLKFNWSANSRCDVDLETMEALKKIGARLFCVGIESGDQEVLDSMKKNITVERIESFFKDAKQAGILIHGCFLVGNPKETKETLEKTLEFAKALNPDTAQFFPIMIYPGTEAYAWAQRHGYLTTTDFSDWLTNEGLHNCVVSRPGLTNDDLVEFCDRARKEFYLRPKYIWKKTFQGIRDPYEFMRLVKGAKNLSKYLFKTSKSQKSC